MKSIRLFKNLDPHAPIDLYIKPIKIKSMDNKNWDDTIIKQSIRGNIISYSGENKDVYNFSLQYITKEELDKLEELYNMQYIIDTYITNEILQSIDRFNSVLKLSSVTYDNKYNLYTCKITLYKVE